MTKASALKARELRGSVNDDTNEYIVEEWLQRGNYVFCHLDAFRCVLDVLGNRNMLRAMHHFFVVEALFLLFFCQLLPLLLQSRNLLPRLCELLLKDGPHRIAIEGCVLGRIVFFFFSPAVEIVDHSLAHRRIHLQEAILLIKLRPNTFDMLRNEL